MPPEILVLSRELLHELLVCLPHRLDLEQPVGELKGYRLGLRYAEPHEDDRDERHGREEEVYAVSPRVKHLRRETTDHEIPEPVVGGCIRLAKGSVGFVSATILINRLVLWDLPSVLVENL